MGAAKKYIVLAALAALLSCLLTGCSFSDSSVE